ncbi:amidohydrolase family protein [Streptomyces sp. NA02950]|uniref:amidohydrolase family protein n=1 Tax=Streptomyces sp. NA02950 TaxID=2742137 RepID=UPI0015915CCA|nr:amidohydrolase family protein [Streptomyces sp. NA02950]QKV96003.1 amidohydrolase family protein [Streptomyces sp. NA02950]
MSPSRSLIKGGYVLSMDPQVGEIPVGDILVEDDRIARIAPHIDADAEVIDAEGCVVMPGMVDTHRHTWQTALRGICADWSLKEYMTGIRMSLLPAYSPADVYAGNYVGAVEALDAGVTTVLDFSHCVNTPDDADEAYRGLADAGIRAVYGYGFNAAPSETPYFTDHDARIRDARRVAGKHFSGGDELVRMGVSLSEPGFVPFSRTKREIDTARELGALITVHTACFWGSRVCRGIREMDHLGLLGPDQVHVHCNALDDDELAMLARAGAKVSCTPESEIQMGMGHPVISRSLNLGIKPTLGCDIISLSSGDLFTQMRMGLQDARCLINDPLNALDQAPDTLPLSVRDALAWGTVNGAEALGLADVTGTLAPGKKADIVVVGGGLNVLPRPEPVGAMVVQANAANVRTVLVNGVIRKRDGELVGVSKERLRQQILESTDRLFERVNASGGVQSDASLIAWDSFNDIAAPNLAEAYNTKAADA